MKVYQIKMTVKLEGRGILNWNGKRAAVNPEKYEQKDGQGRAVENTSFGKFIEEADGKIRFTISPGRIKRNLLGAESVINNTFLKAISKSPRYAEIMANLHATPESILRGSMYTFEGQMGYRRSSPLTITEAVADKATDFSLTARSSSLTRDSNSLFYKQSTNETEMTYTFKSVIDLSELAFFSCESSIGRAAFPGELFEQHVKTFKKIYPGLKVGMFSRQDLTNALIFESGIHLDQNAVKKVLTFLFDGMRNYSDRNAEAYAEFCSASVEFIGKNEKKSFDTIEEALAYLDLVEIESVYKAHPDVTEEAVIRSFVTGENPNQFMADVAEVLTGKMEDKKEQTKLAKEAEKATKEKTKLAKEQAKLAKEMEKATKAALKE